MAELDQQIVHQIPFTQVPNWIFGKLSPPELAVLCVLLSFGTTQSFPSHGTIASLAMISKSSVQRALSCLDEKQIIRWTRRKKADGSLSSNLYEVLVWDLASQVPMVKLTEPYSQIDWTLPSNRPDPTVRLTEEQDLSNKTQRTRNKKENNLHLPKPSKSKIKRKDELIQLWIENSPIEFNGYLEQIQSWLEQRWENHAQIGGKDPWGAHQRSAKALRYAITKNVADEFLGQAAERGWLSLGFSNWEQKIDQIGKTPGKAFRVDPLDTPRSTKKEICMQWRSNYAEPDSNPIPLAIADLTIEHATTGQFFFAGETAASQEAKQLITMFRSQINSKGINQ